MKKAALMLSLLAAVAGGAGPVGAQTQVPASQAEIKTSFAPVVKAATPAVVNIYTSKIVRQRMVSPLFNDPIFQQFFGGGMMPEGMTRKRLENALGSGVIVRADGLIVTCEHVIKGADEIKVVLGDRREFDAKIVTSDSRTDLALLRIETKGEKLPHLDLRDSDEVEVGDLVLAIGNPFGVGQTVTSGIVSALARTSTDINDMNYFIQTDAAINPGNSGGALVSMDGRLLGVNAAIYSRSGGNMGIGFAVPSNMVRAMVRAMDAGQKNVVHAWTGIKGQDVTSEIAASLTLSPPSGMLVNALHPASPAKKAGLRIGDVIISVDGKPVADASAFRYRIATLGVGGTANIVVARKGTRETMVLPLIAPPEVPPRQQTILEGRHPLAGAVVANLSPAVVEEHHLEIAAEKGVVVVDIKGPSFAANLGLQPGDIVMAVNTAQITSVDDLQAALRNPNNRWQITLNRNGQQVRLLVGG